MSRPLRIEYPGALYHITSRGIDRREIFGDDQDREHFVQLLKEGADFYKVEVMAYCLMPNHFHFLLSTKKPNLSRFMQRMNTAYTRYYNNKNKRVGPLMQGIGLAHTRLKEEIKKDSSLEEKIAKIAAVIC